LTLLPSPPHRFAVCSAPHERGGCTAIGMVQAGGNNFVF
jgi:hypothetical protein